MNEITYQNQELLSPKSDLVFKALFGQESSKDILLSFLNSVLDLNIISEDNITLPNTERIGEQPVNKSSRLDVCVTVKKEDGHTEHIDIEIQLTDVLHMTKRSIYYASKLFAGQLAIGEYYENLGRVITLNILGINLFEDDKWFRKCRLKDVDTNRELTDCFEINFVELPKLPHDASDINDLKILWMQFLNAKSEEEFTMLANKDGNIKQALNKLQYLSADEQLKYENDMREKFLLDQRSGLYSAEKKGRQEGRQETQFEIAKAMKTNGMDIALIASMTGLSEQDVTDC